MLKIKYELPESESAELLIISDVHIGNPLCNEAEFKRFVDYIKEEPDDPKMARICILNGDLTESVTRNSKGNLFDLTMTPSVQVATMIKYLLPLTETSKKYPMGKIVSYCAGNHDDGRYKDTGISAAESIAVGLHLEDRFSTDGCYSFIKLNLMNDNRKKFAVHTVYNTHLTGGSVTTGAKANRISRVSQGILADLVIGSHFHSPMTFKEDIIIPNANDYVLTQKTITYVISNAFLRYGDYIQRNGYKPGTIAEPKIYIMQGREQTKANCRKYTYTEVLL